MRDRNIKLLENFIVENYIKGSKKNKSLQQDKKGKSKSTIVEKSNSNNDKTINESKEIDTLIQDDISIVDIPSSKNFEVVKVRDEIILSDANPINGDCNDSICLLDEKEEEIHADDNEILIESSKSKNKDLIIDLDDSSIEETIENGAPSSEKSTDDFGTTVKPDECALITSLCSRKFVMPLVKLAVKLKLSANFVTVLGGVSWVLSLFSIVGAAHLFINKNYVLSLVVLFLTAYLWISGYILDVVDGSLSRLYKTSSRRGFYLDYVFHLLFKPGFVVSIGVALAVLNHSISWLYFAVLALASNWTSAESASEHVLCEEIGKNRLNPNDLTADDKKKVFLGTTDIKDSALLKNKGFLKTSYTLLKEVLNYYGQSVFFAVLAIIDGFVMIGYYLSGEHNPEVWNWKIVSWGYLILFSVLILRVPFRIYREYKRISILDKTK